MISGRNRRRPVGVALGLFVASFLWLAPGAAEAQILGLWSTKEGKSHVRIEPCGDNLCGTIVWLKEPLDDETGAPKVDKYNKDEGQRTKPLIGLKMLTDFPLDGDGDDKWSGGRIYNPENGKTYRSKLKLLETGQLKVSGCVLFFCDGQTWDRVE